MSMSLNAGSTNYRNARGPASSRAKRALDVGVAIAGLVLFLPLLLFISIAIYIEDLGPVLLRQQRAGLNGRAFTILKFRTMCVEPTGEAGREAPGAGRRITRVGLFLRMLSLDELPQLLNVLRGDMSLVGPRPLALKHDAQGVQYVADYGDRLRARPGLTGLAQVRGWRGELRSEACIGERVAADNAYIAEWSLAADLRLLVLTMQIVFRDPNAY